VDLEQRKRLKWVRLFEEYGDAGKVCLKCGISRPTLRKWAKRYSEYGIDGLKDQSRKPQRSPNTKVDSSIEKMILDYRNKRKLGARRLQIELQRNEGVKLSLATVHKVLKRNNCKPLSGKRVKERKLIRYSRPVPGERIQMDTCKIAASVYQFTAIDDCTRFQVVKIYPRRTASNTQDFLEKVMEEMPFPIQRVQTGVLRPKSPRKAHGMGHKVQAHQAKVAPSQRKGGTRPENRFAGVLCSRRSQTP
jgi:transposase